MTSTAKTLPLPSILAFSRRLEVSDALMTSGVWGDIGEKVDKEDEWTAIKPYPKRNRATHSYHGAPDAKKKESNLSWGDDAALPHDADTLRVKFSLKVMGNLEKPTACNDPKFENALSTSISKYRDEYQFKELANRYAHNIANGRFLWRNRVGAEKWRVRVSHGGDDWIFDDHPEGSDSFEHPEQDSDLAKLASVVQTGLQGGGFEYLEITAFARLGFVGTRVWPSQEMVLNPTKDEQSKFLFQLNDCAALHSEKIGNALRTIDTWYSEDRNVRAIAVEPFGSVTTRGEAHRPSKNDFYTLLERWMNSNKNGNSMDERNQHYIIATLIRGGVFGKKKKSAG